MKKSVVTTSEYDMLADCGCTHAEIEGFEDMLDTLYTIIDFRGATHVERRMRSLLKATFLLGKSTKESKATLGILTRMYRQLGFRKR